MVLKSEDGLTLLARSMDPNYASMMADVVRLMAAVSLVKYVDPFFKTDKNLISPYNKFSRRP